jgi:hypothetical protein
VLWVAEYACGPKYQMEGVMRKIAIAYLALSMLLSIAGAAQDTANVVGTVTDSSGAAVPKA